VISKKGNSELRYALYQAALIATYHNDQFRALFTCYLKGREKERGIKIKMRVKLAVKVLLNQALRAVNFPSIQDPDSNHIFDHQ